MNLSITSGHGRNLYAESKAHVLALRQQGLKLFWGVGGQLIGRHLSDHAERLAPRISPKLSKSHLLCKMAADIIKRDLLSGLVRSRCRRLRLAYRKIPVLFLENKWFLVHNAAIKYS